ncbi:MULTISPECIES: hypothetical protein [Caulobacter]|uniref:Uncharacterized protein n=1 Tax=Caulobacter vibrioides (strain NA1000 / CB15N) TaxID=565050 RepID=A0A0H3IZD0_CAUVN|nr:MULTISPECIES: hypothetical protein [Caulobacter]YP_009020518.1 hypothetical protein CCNA_03946 [Caulobacter vibrioides NA1000]AHI88549.1 hypothetical protein CCNA_03946 [Caulobacter vibrioides NA1000]QXZ53939.1 hypothetical protein KZH45_05795 [Caulobacter vibrioides]
MIAFLTFNLGGVGQ